MTQIAKKKFKRERDQIRLGLWQAHLKSPVAALAKALECLEQNEGELLMTSEL